MVEVHTVISNLIDVLLLVDAGSLLLLGYKDLKETSVHVLVVPLYFVIPGVLIYITQRPEVVLATIVMTALFVILLAIGWLGFLDLVLPPRIALLFLLPNPVLAVVVLACGVFAAYALFYVKHIRPIVCRPSFMSSRTLIKRDAFLSSIYVFPTGVGIEDLSDEELQKYKRRIYEKAVKRGEECIEGVVVTPYVWLFSVGYALAVAIFSSVP